MPRAETGLPAVPTYRNTEFHRIKPGFMVQGGDYENFDGTGGRSIYSTSTFEDESFANKHHTGGILSMANRGKATNGSQFFITLGNASHLDGKHVAFGRVVHGMDVVMQMASVETDEKNRPIPMQRIVVVDCGIGNGKGKASNGTLRQDGRRSEGKRTKKDKKGRKQDRRKRSDFSSSSSDSSSSDDSSYHRHRSKKHKKRKRETSRSRSRDRGHSSSSKRHSHKERKRSKKKHSRERYDDRKRRG
eukprot:CAMPEP_0181046940 /NCGR_PEP_ID=MMETSP1070-20121207/14611_1 /TAXON_ID=265543 /ORGANISM="Minutocellus polymorphus, Strain NH13" /LENGTH=245 /DNA_ID=CAMNT_0023125573 /DNA_START=109 /DNA_END=843 /DNA_ORIENTATION=+